MKYQPIFIASYENESGLDQYNEEFLIPDKAFPVLEDAYSFRGRVKKKRGYTLLGRLRRELSGSSLGNITSPGAGDLTVNIFALLGLSVTEPNAAIELGSVTTISISIGAQTLSDSDGDGILTVTGAGSITGAILDYASGDLTLTYSGATAALASTFTGAYFPSLPVMGLRTLENTTNINNESYIAFDTIYAYQFSGGQYSELLTGTTWSGTNYNFFWTTNYYQLNDTVLFWVTNFSGIGGDPIRYFDGTAWTTFTPTLNTAGTEFVFQSLIILPYSDHLLLMNTFEGPTLGTSTQYPQRIRYSQNGDPTDQTNGWLQSAGRGGYIDIPTKEAIVSAEYIKDTLLVKCERSSWKVLKTGNKNLPFILQQINTELGAESSFSVVPFDQAVLTVGNYGITADDSVNVQRIDEKIPDIIFKFNNDNEGVNRVYGIRNFSEQIVYWAYPNAAENPTFPNRILVFNYISKTFSIFKDSFTAFGYFQRQSDLTWGTLPYDSWEAWVDPWNSGVTQSEFPDVIGGNQQGYVEILNQQTSNGVSLYISGIASGAPAIFTVNNHNLEVGDFIKLTGIIGTGSPNPDTFNDIIYKVIATDTNTLQLEYYDSITNAFITASIDAGGTYLGGGEITIISNFRIMTKRFSPYYPFGSQVRLGYVDFFLDRTSSGEFTLNLYGDENTSVALNDPQNPLNEGILGDNIVLTRPEDLALVPFQQYQDKIWHRLFTYSITQNFQLEMTLDDVQMSTPAIVDSDFILHAMVLYISDNLRLIQ